MEGWRHRRLGSNAIPHGEEKEKTTLTLTNLLMEGLSRKVLHPIALWANKPTGTTSTQLCISVIKIFFMPYNIIGEPMIYVRHALSFARTSTPDHSEAFQEALLSENSDRLSPP
jgi:hypothetical protein